MPAVVIKINQEGIRALLKSPGVQADLKTRADKIAVRAQQLAAEAGHPDAEFLTEEAPGSVRGRAHVFTANADAMVANAAQHVLLRALDAGRG